MDYPQQVCNCPLCILGVTCINFYLNFYKMMYFCLWRVFLSKQTVQILMKCRLMGSFSWIISVCQVSKMKRVKVLYPPVTNFFVFLQTVWTQARPMEMCSHSLWNSRNAQFDMVTCIFLYIVHYTFLYFDGLITKKGKLIKIKKTATKFENSWILTYIVHLIPLFHTGPKSNELTRIDKYLDSWPNPTQFVMVLTDSHSP